MNSPSEALVVVGQQTRHTFDLRVYSLSALKRAAYRLANRCAIDFTEVSETTASVLLAASPGEDAQACLQQLLEHALDEELRAEVAEKTSGLRDLILAHAFSRTRLTGETER